MSAVNYLCCAAKAAKAAKTNYVIVVRGQIVIQGSDLQAALNQDVRGATLYSFRELTPAELGRAEAAGITEVFVGVTRHVAAKLGLWPEHLEQQSVRYARDVIVAKYVEHWNE